MMVSIIFKSVFIDIEKINVFYPGAGVATKYAGTGCAIFGVPFRAENKC